MFEQTNPLQKRVYKLITKEEMILRVLNLSYILTFCLNFDRSLWLTEPYVMNGIIEAHFSNQMFSIYINIARFLFINLGADDVFQVLIEVINY